MVDEAIVLAKFDDVLSDKIQERLRRTNALFVPNRSFTSYCDLDAIEEAFRVPMFGSRNLLRTEERDFERSYYWILETAKLPAPEKFDRPSDIDGLAIVKLPHKVKKLERGFFTAASFKEYREKSEALLKQGVISKADLAKARIERYIIGPIFNFDFFYSLEPQRRLRDRGGVRQGDAAVLRAGHHRPLHPADGGRQGSAVLGLRCLAPHRRRDEHPHGVRPPVRELPLAEADEHGAPHRDGDATRNRERAAGRARDVTTRFVNPGSRGEA